MTLSSPNNKLKATVIVNGQAVKPYDIGHKKPNETFGTINLDRNQPFSFNLDMSSCFLDKELRLRHRPDKETIDRNRAKPVLQDCTDLRAEVYLDEAHVLSVSFACTEGQSFCDTWSVPNHPAIEGNEFSPTRCKGLIEIDIFRTLLVPAFGKRVSRIEHIDGEPKKPEPWEIFAQWDHYEKPYRSFHFRYRAIERLKGQTVKGQERENHDAGLQEGEGSGQQNSDIATQHRGRVTVVANQRGMETAQREEEHVNVGCHCQELDSAGGRDRWLQQQRERDRQQLEVARGLNERERLLEQRERALDERLRAFERRE
ncbi:hypothetical protein HD553DRAFT_126462 [Filobasidium floriforme]|uniref:uncharacterized protein n=1 Tax=Filobasidium floriforme TaxID=5210 RepID=UPI001E8EB3E6|nr:uncharacterized protein HD553DRAFT_126462 [Filobasidium floriforme]KAH8079956.1 hypothetical protein HD553DRAFT_126462 [Filobasidium floriforme]